MHLLTWTDHRGNPRQLSFMVPEFATKMKEHLIARQYQNVEIVEIRRDTYEYNHETERAELLARNKLWSQLSVEIKSFLAENPDVSLFITPPEQRPKRNTRPPEAG